MEQRNPGTRAGDRDDDLLDDRAAAALLNVRLQTVRNWRWQGRGPRWHRIGQRMVRYRRTDLLAFIEAGLCDKADAA
jgi:hypothetical protein